MAQATATADNNYLVMGMVVTALISLSSGIGTWVAIVRANKPQQRVIADQPLEVKAAADFATKAELKDHTDWDQSEHDKLFRKIGGVERGAADALKSDVNGLHEKINKVDREVAGVSKGMEFQNQQLASIQQSLLNILNRNASSSLP